MRSKKYFLYLLCCALFSNIPQGNAGVSCEIEEDSYLSYICAKALPESSEKQKDLFLATYLQGSLDAKFPDTQVAVSVERGIISLSCTSSAIEKEALAYVQNITAQIHNKAPSHGVSSISKVERDHGIWFPQTAVLFPTQIANPRQPTFSGGVRIGDSLEGKFKAPVALGAQFPLYRWFNIYHGDLQAEIECCAFSLFNLFTKSNCMINADYYVGIPLTYAKDDWRLRARIYHISSHIGDEYLLKHRHFSRKNKSFEAIDFSGAYYINPDFYLFGTAGSYINSDKEMPQKHLYFEYGLEARGKPVFYDQLFRKPFLSLFLRNSQENSYKTGVGIALGYEWGKIQTISRCFRTYIELHHGSLPDGQFSKKHNDYAALKIAYGF